MNRFRFYVWIILIILLLSFRSQARPLNPNMEGNHEMSGGDPRVHGGEVVVSLKRGPVPPSAPSSCTIGGNHKMSSGKCPVGA